MVSFLPAAGVELGFDVLLVSELFVVLVDDEDEVGVSVLEPQLVSAMPNATTAIAVPQTFKGSIIRSPVVGSRRKPTVGKRNLHAFGAVSSEAGVAWLW
jgi:hypothetical protein